MTRGADSAAPHWYFSALIPNAAVARTANHRDHSSVGLTRGKEMPSGAGAADATAALANAGSGESTRRAEEKRRRRREAVAVLLVTNSNRGFQCLPPGGICSLGSLEHCLLTRERPRCGRADDILSLLCRAVLVLDPAVLVLDPADAGQHGTSGKAMLRRIEALDTPLDILIWSDGDAVKAHALPADRRSIAAAWARCDPRACSRRVRSCTAM